MRTAFGARLKGVRNEGPPCKSDLYLIFLLYFIFKYMEGATFNINSRNSVCSDSGCSASRELKFAMSGDVVLA